MYMLLELLVVIIVDIIYSQIFTNYELIVSVFEVLVVSLTVQLACSSDRANL